MRGLIERRDDEIISLMEIGTEKAYRQAKASSTANFFVSLSVALSIFFTVAFLSAWSLMNSIQNNYSRQILAFNLESSTGGAVSLQEKATNFNDLINQVSAVLEKEPIWSRIIKEVKERTVAGVVINNLSLPGAEGTFAIVGVAKDRDAINRLRYSFESSEILSNINIPLDNLGKKNDIPFSLTFTAKDKTVIYAK